MTHVTATELGRNLRRALDRVVFEREELVVVRNREEIARIVPGPGTLDAHQAFGDLFGILAPEAGETWADDARGFGANEGRVDDGSDPWRG
jgi:hypothetical protein